MLEGGAASLLAVDEADGATVEAAETMAVAGARTLSLSQQVRKWLEQQPPAHTLLVLVVPIKN